MTLELNERLYKIMELCRILAMLTSPSSCNLQSVKSKWRNELLLPITACNTAGSNSVADCPLIKHDHKFKYLTLKELKCYSYS